MKNKEWFGTLLALFTAVISGMAMPANKIFVVDSDILLRLGPRLPQGVELIARYLHPEVFIKMTDTIPTTR